MRFIHVCGAVCAAAAFLHLGRVTAGPLTPPAGPVAPTYKTLSEVEPRVPIGPATTPGDANALFRITQPGSYYLTGNVTGVSGKNGIEIAASGVSIDLMGFELVGVPGSRHGLFAAIGTSNVSVRDGVVRGWGNSGALLSTTNALLGRVIATGNTEWGLGAGYNAVFTDCTASGNGRFGITGDVGSTYARCAARGNGESGFITFQGSAVADCTAVENTGSGFWSQSGATYRGCASYGNDAHGFLASGGTSYEGCTSDSNTGSGYSVGSRSTLTACAANGNGAHGILCGDGAKVIDCASFSNRNDGIQVSADSLVRGNACDSNGSGALGSGIYVAGAGNRVEANTCTDNDNGIDVDGAQNLIIRNSVGGNTTFGYAIAPGNLFGPNIFNAAGIAGSNNPHANYEF